MTGPALAAAVLLLHGDKFEPVPKYVLWTCTRGCRGGSFASFYRRRDAKGISLGLSFEKDMIERIDGWCDDCMKKEVGL